MYSLPRMMGASPPARSMARRAAVGSRKPEHRQLSRILPGEMENIMATNKQAGDGHRNGAVRKRSQLKTAIGGEAHFTKRDKNSGQFMAQRKDEAKFKGVRRET